MMADRIDGGITIASKVGSLILVGWFACSWWYGTGTFKKAKQAIPVLQAEAGCEHYLARKATALAKQTTIVDPSQIPKDNCPRPSSAK